MSVLLNHFTQGTEGTVTGEKIGMEIETDFLRSTNYWGVFPISEKQSVAILSADGKPPFCELKLELGRQKLELAIAPQSTFKLLMERAQEALTWLYSAAEAVDAFPSLAPDLPEWAGFQNLLWVREERDQIWVQLDGKDALNHLCCCSSVQFMIDVNPTDAITIINKAWGSRLQYRDYDANDRCQRAYIKESTAKYRPDRYGGPVGFDDMADYVHELEKHAVVMHHGRPVRINVAEVRDLEVDLFLRSVWWHFRLRRFGNTLALEMRPFSRRRDEDIPTLWKDVAKAIGL